MKLLYESRIKGDFEGWDRDKVFELDNGTKWQQRNYKYKYHYCYRPKAKIYQNGSRYFLHVECVNDRIEVIRVN